MFSILIAVLGVPTKQYWGTCWALSGYPPNSIRGTHHVVSWAPAKRYQGQQPSCIAGSHRVMPSGIRGTRWEVSGYPERGIWVPTERYMGTRQVVSGEPAEWYWGHPLTSIRGTQWAVSGTHWAVTGETAKLFWQISLLMEMTAGLKNPQNIFENVQFFANFSLIMLSTS